MKGVGWQAVVIVGMGLGAFLTLYALVPQDEPEARAGLIALVGALGSAGVALIIGRRQDKTDAKVDQVIHQTNGGSPSAHHTHQQSDGRPTGQPDAERR